MIVIEESTVRISNDCKQQRRKQSLPCFHHHSSKESVRKQKQSIEQPVSSSPRTKGPWCSFSTTPCDLLLCNFYPTKVMARVCDRTNAQLPSVVCPSDAKLGQSNRSGEHILPGECAQPSAWLLTETAQTSPSAHRRAPRADKTKIACTA